MAVLLALVVAAPVIGWVWLTSESGGRWIRDFAVSAANEQLQGRLEIDRVRLLGLLRFELAGARLHAPVDSGLDESAPVASLDRIVVDVRLPALLTRRVELAELSIDGPRVHLVPHGDSTNLARAIAPRVPADPEPEVESSGSTALPDLAIHAPSIAIRQASFRQEGESPVDVGPVDLTVSASGRLDDLAVAIALQIAATEPVERQVTLDSKLRYRGTSVDVDSFLVTSGGIRLSLSGGGRLDGTSGELRSLELLAPAADVNELAPAAKLLGDVRVVGKGGLSEGKAALALDVSLPSGGIHANANVRLPDLLKPMGYDATIRVDALEPQRVVDGLPAARVTATLEVDGEGLPPDNVARVRLDASGTRYENLTVDRFEFAGLVKNLDATIDSLLVRVAGLTVGAKGVANAEQGRVRFDVNASDLAATRRALIRGLGLDLPELSGSVAVSGSVAGEWSEPEVEATVTSPNLVAAGTRLERARIFVSADRFTPLPRGRVEVDAGVLDLGTRVGRDLSVRARLDGDSVKAGVTGTFDGLPIGFTLDGRKLASPEGIERWDLSSITARAFGIQFASRRTARLESGNGRHRIQGLVLEGNLGRITLDAAGGSTGPLDAKLVVSGLRLDSIPEELVPGGLPLSGVLGLDATVGGTAASPRVDASVRFDDGSFRELKPFALSLDAQLANDRARATARLSLPNDGDIRLAASAPVDAMSNRRAPLSTSLTLEGIDLALLRAIAPESEALEGRLTGALTVAGSLLDPRISGRVHVHDVAARGIDGVAGYTSISYADRALALGVNVDRPGALDVDLRVNAPIDLPALIDDSSKLNPKTMTADIRFALAHLDLGWLSANGFAPEGYAGRVKGQVAFDGSMLAPKAMAEFDVFDLAASGYTDIDANLKLSADQRIELALKAKQDRAPLAELNAAVAAPPGRLAEMETADFYDLPVMMTAKLLPSTLARLLNESPNEAVANGVASAVFELSGTANAPRFSLEASVDDMLVEGRSVGALKVASSYANELTSFDARFDSSQTGHFLASLRMPGALGASVVLNEGTDALLSRPADVRIEADKFEIAVLNGFVSSVRDLAGTLDMKLLKTGPLNGYDLSGTIALRDGRMSPGEYGTYHAITMDTAIDFPKVKISTLSGSAGKGGFDLRLDAEADDALEKIVAAFELDVNDLPLVQNFQRRADLSMKLRATGTMENDVLTIPELRISGGRLFIPEKLPKAVQDVDPHPDIVFDDDERIGEEAPDGSGMLVRATVVIPDDFIVEAPLGTVLTFGSRLDVSRDPMLLLQGADSALDVVGNVRVVRGTINLLGRRFNVDDGRVQFLPRNFKDPSLAIKAHFEGPDATVLVDISGNASDPKTNFSSNPPMDEAEIFLYMMTGKRQTRAQSGTVEPGAGDYLADAGLAALGSTAASVMKGALKQVLPKELEPDVLSVESSGGQVRTRAGKFITDRLYLGTQIHPGADVNRFENTVEMEGEYRITDDTYLRGRGGDSGRFNTEFLFQKEIPTREQRGAKK